MLIKDLKINNRTSLFHIKEKDHRLNKITLGVQMIGVQNNKMIDIPIIDKINKKIKEIKIKKYHLMI